jgi:predicted ATP-binding protein involved in virulence
MGQLKEFVIYGLWEERNYQLKFEDEKLVIVGENGSGKTTVLRIFYDTISGKWERLLKENFRSVKIIIDNAERSFTKEDLGEISLYEDSSKLLEELPYPIRRRIEIGDRNDLDVEEVLDLLHGIEADDQYQELINSLENKLVNIPQKIRDIDKWIKEKLPYKIIYYPTYRRVECKPDVTKSAYGHSAIRGRRAQRRLGSNLEIAYSGMKDVDEIIKINLNEIEKRYYLTSSQLNMSCFKGILTQDYEHSIKISDEQADPEYIEMVFNSITGITLLEQEAFQVKDKLLEILAKDTDYSDYDKIVIYYYNMLALRFSELKKAEEKIERFFYACNQYLTYKQFEYSPKDFRYSIKIESHNGEKREMSIEQLSSGEKQIVALFCYLYLSDSTQQMIIIDEPELSLSVDWQERILEDILKGSKCKSLVVATQSPFVYDNSLRPYAHSIEEFLVLE